MPPPNDRKQQGRNGTTRIQHNNQNQNHTQNNSNSRYAAAHDRNRSTSSWQEWEEGGTSFDEGGYQSSGALSSEGATNQGYNRNHSSGTSNHAAVHASLSSSFDHGCYNPMSSVRSVGSTSSHGSGHGRGFGGGFGFGNSVAAAAHLVNGETRFPTATSYASDAQRSDVATVCSGSVMEEYEVESVVSTDLNNPGPAAATSAVQSSPPSSVKMTVGASIAASTTQASVANLPASDCINDIHRESSGMNNDQIQPLPSSSTKGQPLEAVVPQNGVSAQAMGMDMMNGGLYHHSHLNHVADSLQRQPDPPLALHSNMGPPLSRKLLLQQQPQHQHRHHTSGNSSQEAGSVKSFESNAGSDLIAHVDTDDCGGSLDMDVHSIHSQEDVDQPEVAGDDNATKASEAAKEGGQEGTEDHSILKVAAVNPLLCSSETNTNGRTSPGGTIYKGRGNRRYQGRYMHLPLKRFHQNGVDLGETDHTEPPASDGGNSWNSGNNCNRSLSPIRHHRQPPRDRKSPRRRHGNGTRKSSRSRSRSRSRDREHNRSPPVDNNGYDDNHKSNISGYEYDNRKPRSRGGRWHQNSSSSGNNRGGRGESWGSHSDHRNGYKNSSSSYNDNGNGQGGNNRGPVRTRSKRRSPRR